ncbi:MAG: hypothetical protein QOI20_2226 [Acidimicrobiaceae bacterium]|nr:hypothetical protein [Acidimicrobiaceae bacterium]
MSRSRPSSRRLLVVVLAVSLTAAACVHQSDPTVGVSKIQARLVFGVKEETTAPPLPTASVASAAAEEPLSQLLPLQFEGDDAFNIPDTVEDVSPNGDCPKAPNGSPIDPVSEVNVTGVPAEGVYKWRFDRIENPTPTDKTKDVVKSSVYVQRAVRNVKDDQQTITFDLLEPGPKDTTIITTFQTKRNGTKVDPPNLVGVVAAPRAGDPERGVVLKKQVVIDNTNTQAEGTRPLAPVTGLLILPLDVSSGENFQTAAVDSKSGDTLVADVTVGAREIVDACGKLTSGWAVTASQSRTAGDNPSKSDQYLIDYVVATQFGGLIVRQRTAFTPSGGATEIYAVTLASLTPTPLPDALKT